MLHNVLSMLLKVILTSAQRQTSFQASMRLKTALKLGIIKDIFEKFTSLYDLRRHIV